MRNPGSRLLPVLIVATFIVPRVARAEERHHLDLSAMNSNAAIASNAVQENRKGADRDSLWNGILIGAAIGAGVGMFFLPQQLCGAQDTECSTIVRGAVGLPVLAGSIGLGALIDGLATRDHHVPRSGRVAGAKMNIRF